MDIVSRADAKTLGLKRYFTGKPCKRSHTAERFVSTRQCAACQDGHKTRWYAANPEAVKAMNAKPRRVDPQKARDRQARWRANNKGQANAATAKWQRANPGIVNAKTRKRQATKARATPLWLTDRDHDAMCFLYEEAAALSKYTGVQFHVDHIVPLRGKTVSGLHVPWNLQVLAASKNRSKHNKLIQQ